MPGPYKISLETGLFSTQWWNEADWSIYLLLFLLNNERCADATPRDRKQSGAAQRFSVSSVVNSAPLALHIRSAKPTAWPRAFAHAVDLTKADRRSAIQISRPAATTHITNTQQALALTADGPG